MADAWSWSRPSLCIRRSFREPSYGFPACSPLSRILKKLSSRQVTPQRALMASPLRPGGRCLTSQPLSFIACLKILSKGQAPPPGFNYGLLYLLPKVDSGLASDTRPLSVTNTENRIIAAAVVRSVMPAVLGLVEKSQKGFLWGLSGADHISEINTWFYEGVEKKKQQLLFLLDTNKAFDSIDHEWIDSVLKKVGFPRVAPKVRQRLAY